LCPAKELIMTDTPSGYSMILTTVSNKDDAAKIAKSLLGGKLAACVQVTPIDSFYTWKGEMANEAEFLLLIKTRSALINETIDEIKRQHPYETPEIVATDFVNGSAKYFSWIDEVTK
jgi:periplasmic divalent cation tolerance protein